MAYLDRQIAYEAQRIRRMEEMVAATERKLAGLYQEARRYRLNKLLESPCAANAAWDRDILLAKLDAAAEGRTYTMEVR